MPSTSALDEGAWGTVTALGSQSCGVLRGLDPLDRATGSDPMSSGKPQFKMRNGFVKMRNIR